jgi:soluble lytic murein transglycosylase
LNAITAASESGNRDFYGNGQPVISPKGAMYSMQVMPSTAGNPGFGVRPAQSQTPAEYNRVGRDYLSALRSRYNGDLAAMWGAYNAGPGTVDKLMAKYGRDWWRHAPAETQAYVERNLGGL